MRLYRYAAPPGPLRRREHPGRSRVRRRRRWATCWKRPASRMWRWRRPRSPLSGSRPRSSPHHLHQADRPANHGDDRSAPPGGAGRDLGRHNRGHPGGGRRWRSGEIFEPGSAGRRTSVAEDRHGIRARLRKRARVNRRTTRSEIVLSGTIERAGSHDRLAIERSRLLAGLRRTPGLRLSASLLISGWTEGSRASCGACLPQLSPASGSRVCFSSSTHCTCSRTERATKCSSLTPL